MKLRFVPLVALALTTPALVGCIGNADEPLTTGSKNVDGAIDSATGTAAAGTYPAALKPLTTTLTSSAEWVKPGEAVTLTATAPAGAKGAVTYSWSMGDLPEGWGAAAGDAAGGHDDGGAAAADPHAGHDMGGGASAPAQKTSLDTGDIAPGAASAPMKFADEGIYLLHCHPHPFMKTKVVVRNGAKAKVAHMAILDGPKPESYRFAPEEVEIAPGGKVVFWNNGTLVHTATEEGREPILNPIPGTGASITFTPNKDGDFRVVVTARDSANGVATAAVRLLVDSAKPDAVKTYDPKGGSYNLAAQGQTIPPSDPNKLGFVLDYAASTLTITFTTTTQSPAPASIQVDLVPKAGGSAIATANGPSGEIVAADVPKGEYDIVVTPLEGAAVEYTIELSAVLVLVPPAPGEAGGHGGGGHAH